MGDFFGSFTRAVCIFASKKTDLFKNDHPPAECIYLNQISKGQDMCVTTHPRKDREGWLLLDRWEDVSE